MFALQYSKVIIALKGSGCKQTYMKCGWVRGNKESDVQIWCQFIYGAASPKWISLASCAPVAQPDTQQHVPSDMSPWDCGSHPPCDCRSAGVGLYLCEGGCFISELTQCTAKKNEHPTLKLLSKQQTFFSGVSPQLHCAHIVTIMSSSGFRVKSGTVAVLLGYPTGNNKSSFSFTGRWSNTRRRGPQFSGVVVTVTRPTF